MRVCNIYTIIWEYRVSNFACMPYISKQFYMMNKPVQNEVGRTRSSVLFQDFQNLQRIWTHPRVLRYNSDRYEQLALKKRLMASDDEEGSLKDFIDDDDDDSDDDTPANSSSSSSSSDGDVQSVKSVKSEKSSQSDQPSNSKQAPSRRTRATAKDCKPT